MAGRFNMTGNAHRGGRTRHDTPRVNLNGVGSSFPGIYERTCQSWTARAATSILFMCSYSPDWSTLDITTLARETDPR